MTIHICLFYQYMNWMNMQLNNQISMEKVTEMEFICPP